VRHDEFLFINENTAQLIDTLKMRFSKTYQGTGDADTLIVKTAFDVTSEGHNVIVVETDIDLLAILLSTTPSLDILFMKPSAVGTSP